MGAVGVGTLGVGSTSNVGVSYASVVVEVGSSCNLASVACRRGAGLAGMSPFSRVSGKRSCSRQRKDIDRRLIVLLQNGLKWPGLSSRLFGTICVVCPLELED